MALQTLTVAVALLCVSAARAVDNVDCFVENGERNYVGTETRSDCVPWSNLGPSYASFFAPEMTYATMGSYCRGINNGAGGVFCYNGGGFSWCSQVPKCTSAAATTTTTTTTTQAPTPDPSGSCGGYADLVGAGETHSKCLPVSSACTILGGLYTLVQADKTTLEDGHNAYRSDVALGVANGTHIGIHGPAKNMKKLEWDDEVQGIAQAWTNQCRDIQNLHYGGSVQTEAHDCNNCRKTLDGAKNGQNAYWTATTGDFSSITAYLQSAMSSWADEMHLDFNPNVFDGYYETTGVVYGHYTQMIWGSTERLGCGLTKYRCSFKDKDDVVHEANCTLVACNYKTAGNTENAPVFESGAAECTSGGSLDSSTGLCA